MMFLDIKKKHRVLFLAVFALPLSNCVEPFLAETKIFESTLVIDAIITNELKTHSVRISRSYTFEAQAPTFESNAQVQVSDDTGTTYQFIEVEPGTYKSEINFETIPGQSYMLNITTSDNRSYVSESVVAPQNIPIKTLTAERQINDIEEEGVSILLGSSSEASKASYFRYEYEETYKIIAPKYDPFEFEVIDYTPCDGDFYEVGLKSRTEEERVCYSSAASSKLIQASTADLSDNTIDNVLIRFVRRDNYIMSHRYSILVKQFSQTQDAYAFYEQLGSFSSSDNIFSQIQPGFLEGNVNSKTNQNEKVLGYFEVASVSEKRVYFNYADLFPNADLPPYAVPCSNLTTPPLVTAGYHCDGMGNCDGDCSSPLIDAILAKQIVFAAENENPSPDSPGPYFVLPSPCGDCTRLGSNIVPDFWEE